jgi:hypothetical protein
MGFPLTFHEGVWGMEVYCTHSTMAQDVVGGQLNAPSVLASRKAWVIDKKAYVKIIDRRTRRLSYALDVLLLQYSRQFQYADCFEFFFAVESWKCMPIRLAIRLWLSVLLNIYLRKMCWTSNEEKWNVYFVPIALALEVLMVFISHGSEQMH